MSPEDLDVAVFGSAIDARAAEVGTVIDGLVDIARRRQQADGLTQAQTAAFMEFCLTSHPENRDPRSAIALAHAAARLALLPDPPASGDKQIRQWVVTDPLGLPHVFEDEHLAMLALLRAPYNDGQAAHLVTPDGTRYTVTRGWQ